MELEGEIPDDCASWFGADESIRAAGRTMLVLTVTDQSALHAVLRRVHDLHLRLWSLVHQMYRVNRLAAAARSGARLLPSRINVIYSPK